MLIQKKRNTFAKIYVTKYRIKYYVKKNSKMKKGKKVTRLSFDTFTD